MRQLAYVTTLCVAVAAFAVQTAQAEPLSAAGRVDLDTLGERALVSYLYARTTIGHDFARPCVQAQALH